MTKEELKQEAEKYVKQNYCEMCVMADDCKCGCIDCFTVRAYIASAEPREKEIKSLGERCLQLQKDKGELIDKVRELEKENAELKHTIATLRQEKDNVSMHAKAMEVVAKTRSDQLTKAKELLKRFITLENCTLDYDDIKEAEQFINSEVNNVLS